MARNVKTSFNGGEFSERLYGRMDLEKYASGCKTMQDFLPMPHGGATRRTGFQYIGATKTSSKISRLIPFQFSTVQAYIIEAGDNYMRFYMNGGQVQTVDSNTKLLLHCDGVNASQTFVDDGNTDHTSSITVNGTVQHSTSTKKFGSASGMFPGATGDYITISDHADWEIIAETNACAELQVRFADLTQDTYLLSHYESSTDYWTLWWDYSAPGGYFKFVVKTGGSEEVSASSLLLAIDKYGPEWHHLALCKVGSAYGIYLDGQQIAYDSSVTTATRIGPLEIGRSGAGGSNLEGFMDEVRIYHGNPFSAAPNSSNSDTITPPTLAYPFVGGAGGATNYELATTYNEEEIELLDWVQSADTLYITSPDRCPRKLTRTDHDSWSIADLGFDENNWPPFLDKNTTATTISSSATAKDAATTLTASASLFNSDMQGSWFALQDGYVKIDADGYNSPTSLDGVIQKALTVGDATADWWQSAWSDDQGWPVCATFYEDRLGFGGPANNPDRIDLSTTAGYENFYRAEFDGGTAAADDAIAVYLSSRQVNAIKWMAGTRKLLVGTSGGEWWLDGGGADEALDATATIRRHLDSEHGSSDIKPALIGNTVMFLQRLGRTLREFYYDWQIDQYVANNVSIMSEHLTNRAPITALAWQQFPHQILWALRSDGVLLSMTYMREHEVVGWSQHAIAGTDATVESIATIEGADEDELWTIAKRTIDGSVTRYIERMSPLVVIDNGNGDTQDWELEDAFFVDSGLTYRGAEIETVTGLSHLEGEAVVALADGRVETGLTVDTGSVTISRPASVIHVGLNYYSDLENLWPIHRDSEGLLFGYPQRITNAILMLYRTAGGKVGPDSTNLNDIAYPAGYGVDVDERVTRDGSRRVTRGGDVRIVRTGATTTYEFYTGLTEDMSIEHGHDCYPTVYIRQDEPLPMTVTAIVTDIQ